MGVVTSAHGIRINADPYPFPRPNRVLGQVAVPVPAVTVTTSGGGTAPTPVLVVVGGTTGVVPHTLIAQAFGSSAGSTPITHYSFDWEGNGSVVTDATTTAGGSTSPIPIAWHEYTTAGTRTLRLNVTDANGNTTSTTQTITVSALPAVDMNIVPGDNIVARLNTLAANQHARIGAGTYTATGTRWIPKSGQTVSAVTNGTVTITGNSAMDYFALFGAQTGVTIKGVRIIGFTQWAIQGGSGGSGATVQLKNVEMDTNGTNGVVTGAFNGFHMGTVTIANCHMHHNRSYNVASGAQSTVYIIGGEYDHGFTDTSGAVNPNAGDGVHKHVHSKGDYVVGAYSHDNQGAGFWWDGSNINVYACLNTIDDNYGIGLFSEINDAALGGPNDNEAGNLDSSGFSIRFLYNTLNRNGYPSGSSFFPTGNIYPANLWVSKSDKIEIAYNIVNGGAHGLDLDYQVGRPLGHNLANIAVHHNDFLLRETSPGGGAGVGRVGFHNSVAGTAYSLTSVTFHHNRYYAAHDSVASGWTHFMVYAGTSEIATDFTTWRNTYGYDTSGSSMSLDTAWPH